MNKPKTVDEFIKIAPKEVQGRLKEIRSAIKEAAPSAEEKLSYGIPYYHNNGRLVYFANSKNHIGLYFPPPFVENHKEEVKEYKTSKSGIQFPNDKKLPLKLIEKLVREQAKINEAK